MSIRVLLVDDDPLVRSGLRLMLEGADDLAVVGELDDGSDLATAVEAHGPHVVLLDVRMPRRDGVSALHDLVGSGLSPLPAVLVLTTLAGEGVVLDALRAGAAGFLLKHTPPEQIVAAVRAAAAGEPVLSATALRHLIDHVATSTPAPSASLDPLSEREREVAMAVAEGLSNADIAARLHFSAGTVKAHLSSALTKLGLDNRTQLAIAVHEASRGAQKR